MPKQTELAKSLNFKLTEPEPEPAKVEAPVKPQESLGQNQMLVQAILGLAPILAGAALGGSEGGAAGARAGLRGLEVLEAGRRERETKETEAKKLEMAEKKQAALEGLMAQKEARTEAQRAEELAISRGRLNLEQQKFLTESGATKKLVDKLDPENQIAVEKLSKDSALKASIATEISQTIASLDDPKISQDLKVKAGEGLLKVLNSTQGADAVGMEEARRLGNLLEFKILNLRQPGSVFGRDIELFRDQAALTVNRLSSAISANRKLISTAMENKPIEVPQVPLLQKQGLPSGLSGRDAVAAPSTERQKRIMELRQQLGK